MLTTQQVFDKVSAHLLKQNKQAINTTGSCVLRNNKGEACAIGCLIPDDKYSSRLEASSSYIRFLIKGGYLPVSETDHQLLCALQTLHDDYDPVQWREGLRQLAEDYGLSYSFLATRETNPVT